MRQLAVAAALRRRVVSARSILLLLLPVASLLAHGPYHERIAYLIEETKRNPSDPVPYFELGNLHGQHGDLELALVDLERVDALAPGKFQTDYLRSQALLVAGEFAKAKEALDRQLASHPEIARAWLMRAQVEQKLGHDQASLADYREALRRTPSPEPDLIQEVANALATHGREDEAAQVLAAGMAKLGKIPSLVLRAIDLEIATKNFDAALRRIEEARQAAPRPEPWMARRAAVLAQADRIEESREAWIALEKHLASLPDQERTSRAMTNLSEEASRALAALKTRPITESSPR